MNMLNERKGITLVSLAITIVVLIILASIGTSAGIDVIKQAKLNAFTTELEVMQVKVNELYDEYSSGNNEVLDYGKDLSLSGGQADKVLTSSVSGITDNKSDYRYYDKTTINALKLEGIDSEFFVNVKTRSVVSYNGMEYEGVTYYTLEQLPQGLYNVNYEDRNTGKPTFELSCDNWTNGKSNIKVSNIQYSEGYINKWEVKYKLEGRDYWTTSEDLSFFVDTPGMYTVKIINGDIESEEKQIEAVKANAPEFGNEMKKISFNESGETIETGESGFNRNLWYDYGNKKWANTIVTIDNIDSYFVWIPRFAYKITYQDSNDKSKGGTIDVKFLIGTTDQYYDNGGNLQTAKRASTGNEDTSSDYYVHPVFTNNVELGGWSKELSGIWIGKYESARSDAGTTKENIGTSTKIKIQPGVTSWRETIIGNMYTYAKEYSKELNSHMLKNSEWGAVAYLTHSKYGRNGTEVTINGNKDYITADGGINVNPEQSSTGNVTGIYDLAGGSSEYVIAYCNLSTSSNLTNYGVSFASGGGKSNEYVTAYAGTEESSEYKSGDATYETSTWNQDFARFIDLIYPFFARGGNCESASNAGIFDYDRSSGNEFINVSFRVCLIVE